MHILLLQFSDEPVPLGLLPQPHEGDALKVPAPVYLIKVPLVMLRANTLLQ